MNRIASKITLLLVVTGLGAGCDANTIVEQAADRAALIEFQEQQQKAHLEYDAELLASMLHDPVIQINRGFINERSRQENIERLSGYFGAVEFLEWEDVEPPRIRISADGTMAYVVVHKSVRLTYEDESGDTQEEHTIFAWLEAWEKVEGEWVLMAGASTNRSGGA